MTFDPGIGSPGRTGLPPRSNPLGVEGGSSDRRRTVTGSVGPTSVVPRVRPVTVRLELGWSRRGGTNNLGFETSPDSTVPPPHSLDGVYTRVD